MDEPQTDDKPKDLDPTLLLESGRASALSDLQDNLHEVKTQAELLESRGLALETTLERNIAQENKRFRRRNNLLITCVFLLLFINLLQAWHSYYVTDPSLDRTERTVNGPLSDANAKLDELVTFIHNQQSSAQTNSEQTQYALQQIARLGVLICASNDSARLEACGETPPPTVAPFRPQVNSSEPEVIAPTTLLPSSDLIGTPCTTLPNGKCKKNKK